MFKKFLEKVNTKILGISLGIAGGASLFVSKVSAAVDPDVASTSAMVADTMKENVTGIISANVGKIVIVGVIIFSIGFTWKLARRFMK